jgi:hypothetical protein
MQCFRGQSYPCVCSRWQRRGLQFNQLSCLQAILDVGDLRAEPLAELHNVRREFDIERVRAANSFSGFSPHRPRLRPALPRLCHFESNPKHRPFATVENRPSIKSANP